MISATYIPRHLILLPLSPTVLQNGESSVKGQARVGGSLRSPLTEPSPFYFTLPPRKRKKENQKLVPFHVLNFIPRSPSLYASSNPAFASQ